MARQWWKTGTVYQIYPKSFSDTNGDGLGDLRGIINKIPYFTRLGVDALWLTPVYPSPQRDNGYDIKDYTAIDPNYGTIDDFKELVNRAHDHGIRVILDIVVNHTSTEHPWFLEAKQSRDNPYRDYYLWRDGVGGAAPNNWLSKFGGSAWQYNEATDDYYLRLFDKTQADLNWENDKVVGEVCNLMRFWTELGVDGFRLDVINLLSKDPAYPDDDRGDGRRFYTDGPKIHQYLKTLNEKVFTPLSLFTVGEMSSTSVEQCIRYSRPGEHELDMVFNFHHLKIDYKDNDKWALQDPDFKKLKDLLFHWQTTLQENDGWNALFWSNHDQPRVVSRYGRDDTEANRVLSAKAFAVVVYAMRGTPYIFQGEEIGLPNPTWSDVNEFNDVESVNYYRILRDGGLSNEEALRILSARSRDNGRVPLPWSDAIFGGFSDVKPWLKAFPRYKEINVQKAIDNPSSVFHFYRELIALRKREAPLIIDGRFLPIESPPEIVAYQRTLPQESLLILVNLTTNPVETLLPPTIASLLKGTLLISNYTDRPSGTDRIALRPFEAVIFKNGTGLNT